MTLHILQQFALQSPTFHQCIRLAKQGDSILLIADGVYALTDICYTETWSAFSTYALREDVQARGITFDHPTIGLLSDTEFVELTTEHEKIITW